MSSNRAGAAAVSLCIALAAGSSFAVPFDDAARTVVAHRAAVHLRELSVLGGLRTEEGELAVPRPIPVEVVQDGGPLWLHEVLAERARRDGAFEPGGGPHVLRAETVEAPGALAVRVGLLRQGWTLKLPTLLRVRIALWVGTVSAVLGALSLRWVRRIGLALLIAGAGAQLGSVLLERTLPFSSAIAPRGFVEAVATGPAALQVRAWANALPSVSTAVGAGLVVLCVLLIVLDHRRSRHRGTSLLWSGLAGLVGALAWLEAGLRTGLDGAATTGWGATSLLLTLIVWVAFARRFARSGLGSTRAP